MMIVMLRDRSARLLTDRSARILGLRGVTILPHGMNPLERMVRIKPAIVNKKSPEEDEDEFNYSESDSTKPTIRLGLQLLKLSRTSYRRFDELPDFLYMKRQEICSYRTTSQIRRSLKSWMIKYDRELQTIYRLKPLTWDPEKLTKTPTDDSSESIKFASTSPLLVYGPEETLAYTHYLLPSRYSISRRIFDDIKNLNPQFQPHRILDFGCGPGTCLASAIQVWGSDENKPSGSSTETNQNEKSVAYKVPKEKQESVHSKAFNHQRPSKQSGIMKYVGIDISSSMIDAAKIMGQNTNIDCTFWTKISEVYSHALKNQWRFDLVIINFTLAELQSDKIRQAATQLLFEMVDINGYIVIVESGSPQGSHTVRTARQFLLDFFKANNKIESKSNTPPKKETKRYALPEPPLAAAYGLTHDDLTVHVVAPCTHDNVCPLGIGHWCSFSQKVCLSSHEIYCDGPKQVNRLL
jgi:SAM-dependent methyltransferase